MLKKEKGKAEGKKRTLPIRLLVLWLALTVLAVAFVIYRRGQMNTAYQADRIIQRLDDYPELLENYQMEVVSLTGFWKNENERHLAEQAAFIFNHDANHPAESDRLAYVADILGASEVRLISPEEESAYSDQAKGLKMDPVFAPLEDGRLLAFCLPRDKTYMHLVQGEYEFLLTCLEAGLPGYVAAERDGSLYFYPDNETTASTQELVSAWLSSGVLDHASLKAEAQAKGRTDSVRTLRSPAMPGCPAGTFTMFCAAYADLDDFVISIVPTRELRQIGMKRTVSLCVLTVAIFLLLGLTLWRTRLYLPDYPSKHGWHMAVRRCKILQILACLTLVLCIIVIQMLSAVNQSAQSTAAASAFLQEILNWETFRSGIISSSFEDIARQRVSTTASFLSDHPDMADLDTLKTLDEILGGAGMRICDADGNIRLSDEVFRARTKLDSLPETEYVFYRAPLKDSSGHVTGFLDYAPDPVYRDYLLTEAELKELLSDLHMLDTLHVLAVNREEKKTIAAAARQSWVGDSVTEHGIAENLLYDGYEGLMTLEGKNLYARVFAANDHLFITGAEPIPAGVFLESIAPLLLGLLLILVIFSQVIIREIYHYQHGLEQAGHSLASMDSRPKARFFACGFMLSLFFLSAVLYMATSGNPTGLTYNIVRGVWVRGVNIVTLTTCIMAVSAIVAVYTLLSLVLDLISGYLTPKGKTLCQMLESASHYIGVIFMILYSLSMLGVETGALVGGVGVTALVFTLGANSLIADVLAGFFIIFEGNITVGDIIIVGGFRGTVTEITIRTTKLKEGRTGDVKIINNSQLKDLINQSQTRSNIVISLLVSHRVGLSRAEELVKKALPEIAARHPEVIGEPLYLGPPSLPDWNIYNDNFAPFPVEVMFQCNEADKVILTFRLNNDLAPLANILLGDPE